MEKFKSGSIEINHHSTSSHVEIISSTDKNEYEDEHKDNLYLDYRQFKDLVATIEKMKEEKHFLVTDKQY